MTAVMVTYPLDVIRARLAFQIAGETFYTGILDAFKVMLTQEGGLKALYRGIVPTMLGMAPYAGLLGARRKKCFLWDFLWSAATCRTQLSPSIWNR